MQNIFDILELPKRKNSNRYQSRQIITNGVSVNDKHIHQWDAKRKNEKNHHKEESPDFKHDRPSTQHSATHQPGNQDPTPSA